MIFIFAAVPAVVASAVVVLGLPGPRASSDLPRFDYVGAILMTPGLIALLYGITQGPAWGWTSLGVVGLIVVSNLMIFMGYKWLPVMIGAFAVGAVATALRAISTAATGGE